MKKIFICLIFAVVTFFTVNAWAASSKSLNVNATVPVATGGLTVSVQKVVGDVWTAASAINFGTLTWDATNHIFVAPCYYAVDIGVTDNSGTAWTLTHTRTSLAKGTDHLNNKVNVSFMKQTDNTHATALSKVSLANSNSVAYTKAALAGGWLRIYYGIGTGSGDNTGVTPIGLDTPAGAYAGTVTITLTP